MAQGSEWETALVYAIRAPVVELGPMSVPPVSEFVVLINPVWFSEATRGPGGA
jgi:hypothetical protein